MFKSGHNSNVNLILENDGILQYGISSLKYSGVGRQVSHAPASPSYHAVVYVM